MAMERGPNPQYESGAAPRMQAPEYNSPSASPSTIAPDSTPVTPASPVSNMSTWDEYRPATSATSSPGPSLGMDEYEAQSKLYPQPKSPMGYSPYRPARDTSAPEHAHPTTFTNTDRTHVLSPQTPSQQNMLGRKSPESPGHWSEKPSLCPNHHLTTARHRGLTTSIAKTRPPQPIESFKSLRPSASTSDFKGNSRSRANARPPYPPLRKYPSYRGSSQRGRNPIEYHPDASSRSNPVSEEVLRTSLRSAQSEYSSGTERSSILTKDTSMSDSMTVSPDAVDEAQGGMSVDDAIDMYGRGFDDDDDDVNENHGIEEGKGTETGVEERSGSLKDSALISPVQPLVERGLKDSDVAEEDSVSVKNLPPPPSADVDDAEAEHSVRAGPPAPPPAPSAESLARRDRYGFRKESQYVTMAEYDTWNTGYTEYLERRGKKWIALQREYGLSTNHPIEFPPRSAKVKRYVRKGLPPDWRGPAWFWYAGGYTHLSENPGVYGKLVEEAENGGINKNDRELIERDLHRTFPDNIRFKPDPVASYTTPGHTDGGIYQGGVPTEVETPLIYSLRRVLQAFSINNPKIGYCQSLNFLVGMLLLFMDEEKAFWMVTIITRTYLPGTHEVNLEGANVDLAVLMMSIRDSMPGIWGKIGGELDGSSSGEAPSVTRLPPVFLCTTAWFMSCFIGTLPTETVLRVWDAFFYEGSKTIFRIALAIFKVGEPKIRAVNDPMEIFQVVQTIPRCLIDANALMEACYKRRGGFSNLSQEMVDERRQRWRTIYAQERAGITGGDAIDPPGQVQRTDSTFSTKEKPSRLKFFR
ncbi:MAG: hypothetical protein M1823_005022 [Watsoniomyces obsoletus]|nr:MAG: hypothetical protein M1823_005022 [Watsoniomyces obsoletus]